jgi:FAD/FMN-containing dehydrogenase
MKDCVGKHDVAYERSRQIGNARFDLFPELICYCSSEDEVRDRLKMARERKLPVRVRSGGHHHEGMCSGDGVMIIDVSPMATIDVDGRNQMARIGPGAKNGDIYEQLWEAAPPPSQIFPGGGCPDVRIAGLVQGGGWGPYSRALGMTCDRVTGFRIVLANGEAIDVRPAESDPHVDLFWAVCGGGGGNFGVVTQYTFQTAWIEVPLSQFTITWSDTKYRRTVLREWVRNFPDDLDFRLTSFCRATALDPDKLDPPVLIGGNCLDGKEGVAQTLQRLLPRTYKDAKVDIKPVHDKKTFALAHPAYQPGPPAAAVQAVPGFKPPDLTNTCAGIPFPHKVSSSFPRAWVDDEPVEAIVKYLEESDRNQEANARRYLSLHCMGGAIRAEQPRKPPSCFAWRDKPFLLQYQAWWADKRDEALGKRCLKWIADFRNRVERYTDGAFINFPDRDLPAKGRIELLEYYYRNNLDRLIEIKRKYDPTNVFDFEMGIPTRK